MPIPLAVLIVEDTESDAQILVRLLKKADYELVYEQVETAEQMHSALKKQTWDIVISDYNLPQFDGRAALTLLRETGFDIPFIIVSGAVGEAAAVAMMKAGAQDYLMKGDLARLVPAVERELAQVEIRRERKRAEEALRVSTAKLETLIQFSPLAIISLDLNGDVTLWNASAEKVFGWSAQEVIGHPNPIVPINKQEEYNAWREQIIQEKSLNDEETVRQRKDGSLINVSISSDLTYDAAGNVTGRMAFVTDITRRKQVEEALAASEAELRALFASMQDVVLVIDRQGVYRKVAPTNLNLLAIPPAELLGKNLRDIFPVKRAESFIDTIQQVLATKQNSRVEYEIRINGHPTWFEAVISFMDTDNTLWVAHDVTARKQSMESLSKSKQQYDNLVSKIPVGIYILHSTPQGAFAFDYVSPRMAEILNASVESILANAQIPFQAVHPDELDAFVKLNQEKIQQREPFDWQGRFVVKGTVKWLHITSSPEPQENGDVLWHGLIADNTERKQAEKAIQTTNILLEQTLEQSPIPMALVSMPDGIIRSANSACRRFLGMDDDPSPIGVPLAELKASYQDLDMQGNPAVIADLPLPRSLRGLKTDAQERHIIRKDGTSVYGLMYGTPIFDNEGKLIAGYLVMTDITERKQAEEAIRQHVIELEMLYHSGFALSQLLNPKEIGQKILELLEEKLGWYNTRIRLYHPQDDTLELLDFNRPGLKGEMERYEVVERFQSLITHSGQGMSGWVVKNGQLVRSGDVSHDPRYVEAYPGIHSGLYVPMKLGERIIGVISIESEQLDAFNAADERLIVTLANQAASAFENARLFEETRKRVMELETLNRISLVLRAVSKQDEMLSVVLDEALSILNTSHGSIELYNKTSDNLDKTITRGWMSQLTEAPRHSSEGIAGKVFSTGETYISREFVSDPETRTAVRNQIPPKWGGICLPIRTTQQTLGVLIVSVPSEHELDKDEIRLLATLSELTGSALQRMQLHEQTVRRLEQLHALRTIDQAISSSRDMHLTLNILLTQTLSQLGVDAANVLLLHSGSSQLELVADCGFGTHLLESINFSDSIAGRVISEHRAVMGLDSESAMLRENLQFVKFWKEEGFICYWCLPLSIKGEIKGVLEVYRRTAFTPDADWLDFLEALAGQAAIAIDSTQLFENLQRANLDLGLAYDATIEGWSRAMDLRDHETEGHTLRVTDLTLKLARDMRISESQLIAIRRGALLHDIGKMGVPDAILLKEGILTDEEWMLMRKHPQLAHDMLAPIAYLNDALNIPYCHHEKWDGTGYPQGLKGERIPLVARIFAVVDVWDALTNDRTYRKKWTKQKARQYIKEQSGRHFDPQVVNVFLKIIEKK